MSKLDVSNMAAGWNAGKNYYAKNVKIADIVIDPEISAVFRIHPETQQGVAAKIKRMGFDRSEPVTLWQREDGTLSCVDGHTRIAAAKSLGMEEIPAAVMDFETKEDAILYCFERQKLRRNLSDDQILTASLLIHNKEKRGRAGDGTGRAAEQMAERIGVSSRTLYRARKIWTEAPEEDLKAVQRGEKTIRSVYDKVKQTRKKETAIETPAPAPAAPASVPSVELAIFDDAPAAVIPSVETPANVAPVDTAPAVKMEVQAPAVAAFNEAGFRFLRRACVVLVEGCDVRGAKLLVKEFLAGDKHWEQLRKMLPPRVADEIEQAELVTMVTN